MQTEQTPTTPEDRGAVPISRRRRSDFGLRKLTERDETLLDFIGEQFAITLPQLARLMNRSERAARALRDRWHNAGWVASGQLRLHGPVYLWLTRDGSDAAGSEFKLWRPKLGMIDHVAAVSDVRIGLEHELRLGRWTCERELARSFPSRSINRPHLPDGLLDLDTRRVAVEVELSLKSRARRAEIVTELSRSYDEVWYFAARSCLAVLRELAEQALRQNLRVHPYTPGTTPQVAA
jgi:hypothetical protein